MSTLVRSKTRLFFFTQCVRHLLSYRVVGYFGHITAMSLIWFLLLQFSGSSTTHGCLLATECDISMLSLKLPPPHHHHQPTHLLPPACSQCHFPLSSIPPHCPSDLDSVFSLPTPLCSLYYIPHFRTNWLLYVLLCSLEQFVLVPSSPPSPLTHSLSLYYTSHLTAVLPSSVPRFLFCLLNNYVLIKRGSPGS